MQEHSNHIARWILSNEEYCTAPKMIPTRNDPQPWNDPQIDPKMIPISLLVDPEMIPN